GYLSTGNPNQCELIRSNGLQQQFTIWTNGYWNRFIGDGGNQFVNVARPAPKLHFTVTAGSKQVTVGIKSERLNQIVVCDARFGRRIGLEQSRIRQAAEQLPRGHMVNKDLVGPAASR